MDSRFWDCRMETLSADRRLALHDHRLHWQVRRCWDASPWHRARLEQGGINPATFRGLRDLRAIPLLTDADLRAAAATHDAASLAVTPEQWWSQVVPDSTRPARVLSDGDATHRSDLAARALWAVGVRPTRAAVTPAAPTGPDAPVIETIQAGLDRLRQRPWHDDGSRPAPLHIERDGIARQPDSNEDAAGVRVAWADAAAPNGAVRAGAMLDRVIGLPYVSPTLAYTCSERSGFHWADDHYIIEVVHPDSHESLPDGQVGAVVITEVTREGTPLLRYWSGVEAALHTDPCPCGRTSARSPFVRPRSGGAPAR